MAGVGTGIFTDPHDYESSFPEAKIDLVVTGRGAFEARLTVVKLPNLHLVDIQECLPRVAFISLTPTRIFVAFLTHFEPPPVWNGIALQPEDIAFHGCGERWHQRTSGPSRWASISVTPEVLAKYGVLFSNLKLVPPPVGRLLRPAPSAVTRLRRLHVKACRLAVTKPDIIAHPEVARSLEHDLIYALVECLAVEAGYDDEATRPRHMAVMARFEDSLAKHVERPLNMPVLCADAGISARTLRTACAEFLGMGPIRYALLRRLNMAHAELRRANSATTCVAELARRYGFSKPKRFAIQYRAVFGESPSITLHRSPG